MSNPEDAQLEALAHTLNKNLTRMLLPLGQPPATVLPLSSGSGEIWVQVSKAFDVSILITGNLGVKGRYYYQAFCGEEDLHDSAGEVVAVEKALECVAELSVRRYYDTLADAAELEQFVADVTAPDPLQDLEDALGYLHAVDFEGDPDWPGVRDRGDAALALLRGKRP